MSKPTHKFDFNAAITVPWNMPGGKSFLFRSLLWASALLLLVYFIFGRGIITAYIDFFQTVIAMEQAGTNDDPAAAMAMVSDMMSMYGSIFLLTIASWVVMVMLETAMHKNVFRGTDKGAVPLRFGRDEFMVMIAQLVVYLCVMGIYMGGAIVLMIVMGIIIAGASASGSAALGVIAGLLTFVAVVSLIAALIIAFMRWAPAAAMSIRDGQQRIFEGWGITKGIGGPLFGAYALVAIGGYILMLIIMVIAMVTLFAGVDLSALESANIGNDMPDFSVIASHFEKMSTKFALVIVLMVYSVFVLLWYMHIWGIGNYAAQLDAKNRNASVDMTNI